MKKKILSGILVIFILAISLGAAGCGSNRGSSTDGESSIMIAGSTSVQPLSEAIAEAYMEKRGDVTIEVQGGGSGQGIKSIEKGIADIGSLSREVKKEERTSVSDEYIIAREGVAVVVNPGVPVDDMTMEQIKDVYTGKITSWKELGGMDMDITVVTREAGSGTRGAFTELTGVLEKDSNGNEMDRTTKDALVQPSTGAVKETVAKTPGSIGYVSLGVLDDTVKAVKAEGTKASVDTVLSGKYKIQRPFVYVTGSKMTEAAKEFVRFAMGREGQAIVKENGFIPVHP